MMHTGASVQTEMYVNSACIFSANPEFPIRVKRASIATTLQNPITLEEILHAGMPCVKTQKTDSHGGKLLLLLHTNHVETTQVLRVKHRNCPTHNEYQVRFNKNLLSHQPCHYNCMRGDATCDDKSNGVYDRKMPLYQYCRQRQCQRRSSTSFNYILIRVYSWHLRWSEADGTKALK